MMELRLSNLQLSMNNFETTVITVMACLSKKAF